MANKKQGITEKSQRQQDASEEVWQRGRVRRTRTGGKETGSEKEVIKDQRERGEKDVMNIPGYSHGGKVSYISIRAAQWRMVPELLDCLQHSFRFVRPGERAHQRPLLTELAYFQFSAQLT